MELLHSSLHPRVASKHQKSLPMHCLQLAVKTHLIRIRRSTLQ